VVGLNVLFVLFLYVPSLEPDPGTSYSPLTGLPAAASLAGLAWATFRDSGERDGESAEPRPSGSGQTLATGEPALNRGR